MSKSQISSCRQPIHRQKGFSLVEFGLVMIVSGLMIAGALGVYASYMKKAKLETAYKRLYEANTLLAEAWKVENRYYCPADPTLQPSDANYGRENCASTTPVGSCTNGTSGVCVSSGKDSGGGQVRVLTGMLPFRTIVDSFNTQQASLNRQLAKAKDPAIKEELRQALNRAKKTMSLTAKDLAFDGWGRQMTYMVSAAWTTAVNDNNPVLKAGGSIAVYDDVGNEVAPRGAHFALLSHGQNGDGAYDVNGRLFGAACATLSTVEQENCDRDASIRRAPVHSLANNAAKTDDLVAFNMTTSNEMWQRVACGTDNKDLCLRNRNVQNVVVGNATATTQKLTVGGMLRADKLELSAKAVCDSAGGNCFSPEYIGGGLMAACPPTATANRWVARRIGPSTGVTGSGVPALNCVDLAVPSYNFTCPDPDNQVIRGFNSGGSPICYNPCAGIDGMVDTETRSCPAGMSGTVTCEAVYSCADKTFGPYTCSDNCVYNPINAQCGPSHGKYMVSAPNTNLCNSGNATAVAGGGPWTWTCQGLHGGSNASCQAERAVNGQCGTSHNAIITSAPSGGGACASGSPGSIGEIEPGKRWKWMCNGASTGGSDMPCESAAHTTVNGQCGSSHGGTYAVAPSDLCATGSASGISTSTSTYTWTCSGSGTPAGSTASCSANRATTVNGQCGTAHGDTFATAPNANLCSAGTATGVNTGASTYTWSCNGGGAPAGANAACTANRATTQNGACGPAHGSQVTSAPTSGLCANGTATGVTGTGPYNWSCGGTGSPPGTPANCSASLQQNGACGAANGVTVSSPPSSNLCNVGSPSAVGGSNPYSWTCSGINGGAAASCSSGATSTVNGSCGTSNGQQFYSMPSSGLCNSGSATAVSGSGPWSWSCLGGGTPAGSDTNCSASKRQDGVCSATANQCVVGNPGNIVAGSCGGNKTWTCSGVNGGNQASCSQANPECAVPGQCGSANGGSFTSAPTSNLCNVGGASAVTTSGSTYSWSCSGSSGGGAASCSATKTDPPPADCSWEYIGEEAYAPGLYAATMDMNCGAVMPTACPGCMPYPAYSCTPGAACASGTTMPCVVNNGQCTTQDGRQADMYSKYTCYCPGSGGGGGGGGGGCFTGTTEVIMADGSRKPIANLKKGDKVRGHTQTNSVVSNKPYYVKSILYRINDSAEAYVTANHPFYTKGGEWKAFDAELARKEHPGMEISELKLGDILIHSDGSEVELKSFETEDHGWLTVYNPSLDGDHTYYANDLLMHNVYNNTNKH